MERDYSCLRGEDGGRRVEGQGDEGKDADAHLDEDIIGEMADIVDIDLTVEDALRAVYLTSMSIAFILAILSLTVICAFFLFSRHADSIPSNLATFPSRVEICSGVTT